MPDLKTTENAASVAGFLDTIADPAMRKDCAAIARMMKRVTRAQPKMWGSSIVGFGRHHYKYASGREGDWFVTGFSPRKGSLTLYLSSGFEGHEALLRKLGKFKTGRSCLYVKSLRDIDLEVLETLIGRAAAKTQQGSGR